MFSLWLKLIIKLNEEFTSSIVWDIDHHCHILLIDKKGNFIFPKNFNPMISNPNKNKLIIKNEIDRQYTPPIIFYNPPNIHCESITIKYDNHDESVLI